MSDLHRAYDDTDDVVAVDDFSIDDALSSPIPVAKGQSIYGESAMWIHTHSDLLTTYKNLV